MMKRLLILLLLMATLCTGKDAINYERVANDSVFLHSLKEQVNTNPSMIATLLAPKGSQSIRRAEDMGFGYRYKSGSMGFGYSSTYYILVFYKDELVSFELSQRMPSNPELTERYEQFMIGLFQFDSIGIKPLRWNYEKATRCLPGYENSIDSSESVLYYMSPYSGIIYGYSGGDGGSFIENRKHLIDLQSRFSPELFTLLLYSINPASRLSAVEYFYGNADAMNQLELKHKEQIKRIFKETPAITTMSGCFIERRKSQHLVEMYAKSGSIMMR